MKKRVLTVIMVTFALSLGAQSNYSKQYQLFGANSSNEVVDGLFRDWQRDTPDDLELYVTAFNHYLSRSLHNMAQVSEVKPEGIESIEFADSLGNKSYLYQITVCDSATMERSQQYIEQAIALRPARLDLRFGQITALWYGGADYLDRYCDRIVDMIAANRANGCRWEWDANDPTEVTVDFFQQSVQEFCVQLFGLSSTEGSAKVRTIAKAMNDLYPKCAIFYTDMGSAYYFDEDYKQADLYYRKALKIDPADAVVLRNLAVTNCKSGNNKKALEYLDSLRNVGSDEDRAFADRLAAKLGK